MFVYCPAVRLSIAAGRSTMDTDIGEKLMRRFMFLLLMASMTLSLMSCSSTPEIQKLRITDLPADADYGDYPKDYERITLEWLEANVPAAECEEDNCSRTYIRIALDGQVDISEPTRAFDMTEGGGWITFVRTYAVEPEVKAEAHHLFFLQNGAVVYHKRGLLCFHSIGEDGGYQQTQRMCFAGARHPGGKAIFD